MSARQLNIESWKEIPCACGKKAKRTTIRYKHYMVRGWSCTCGEDYIHPADSLKVSKLELLKKEKMKVKIGVLGQSLVIRIPRKLSRLYDLKKGKEVEIVPEDLATLEIRNLK